MNRFSRFSCHHVANVFCVYVEKDVDRKESCTIDSFVRNKYSVCVCVWYERERLCEME